MDPMKTKIISALLAIFFVGTSVTTSAAAAMKLFSPGKANAESDVVQVSGVEELQKEESQGAPKPNPTQAQTRPTTVRTNVAIMTPTTSAVVSTAPIATVKATAKSSGCIVTLFGKQYDVTSLQSTHSGGNIFTCGTDMTVVYQKQHGTDVSRMQSYLVSAQGGATGSSGSTGTSGGQTFSLGSDENEDESETERERYITDNENEMSEAEKKAAENAKHQEEQERE